MNMDKYFMWIHYERLHNHNKAKHNKTVCIFLGIYCNTLEYNTIIEDGKQITDPIETTEHIANYSEDIYLDREGTEAYKMWTEQIKQKVKIALRNPTTSPQNQEAMISDKKCKMQLKN